MCFQTCTLHVLHCHTDEDRWISGYILYKSWQLELLGTTSKIVQGPQKIGSRTAVWRTLPSCDDAVICRIDFRGPASRLKVCIWHNAIAWRKLLMVDRSVGSSACLSWPDLKCFDIIRKGFCVFQSAIQFCFDRQYIQYLPLHSSCDVQDTFYSYYPSSLNRITLLQD